MITHPHVYLRIIKNDQRLSILRFKSCTLSSRKFEETWHLYLSDLENDGITFPRNVGNYQPARYNIPEDLILQRNRCEHLTYRTQLEILPV